MSIEVDAGRIAFALSQSTLAMLVASKVIDHSIVIAAANKLSRSENPEMLEHEIATVAAVMLACLIN